MRRRHHYRRRSKEPADLDMTTFLNLMVVLVPFPAHHRRLSRITIVELTLPTSASGPATPNQPSFQVEVIVRENALEISNGSVVIARLPKVEDAYDLATLGEMVMSLKRDHPEEDDAFVLLEPQIEYDHLIQVMDVLRSGERPAPEGEESVRVALFTDIAIGDAP